MDLSVRSSSSSTNTEQPPPAASNKFILKPIARRQPWPTFWYRTMWPTATINLAGRFMQQQPLLNNWCIPSKILVVDENSEQIPFKNYNSSAAVFHEHGQVGQELCRNHSNIIDIDECTGTESKHDPTNQNISSKLEFNDKYERSSKYFPEAAKTLEKSREKEEFYTEVADDVLDIATCDGPVYFERISNPNFALTVKHCCTGIDNESEPIGPTGTNDTKTATTTTTTMVAGAGARLGQTNYKAKIYTCIYCHQSFKSLFCYQKHKKRHINPVSVDLTGSNNILTPTSGMRSENSNNKQQQQQLNKNFQCTTSSTTKYLNVQFFPCKICGCKFPSYYFVHKHIKICH